MIKYPAAHSLWKLDLPAAILNRADFWRQIGASLSGFVSQLNGSGAKDPGKSPNVGSMFIFMESRTVAMCSSGHYYSQTSFLSILSLPFNAIIVSFLLTHAKLEPSLELSSL